MRVPIKTNCCFFVNIVADLNFPGASGESMENALRACCKGIKIGKILIHGAGNNGRQVSDYTFSLFLR